MEKFVFVNAAGVKVVELELAQLAGGSTQGRQRSLMIGVSRQDWAISKLLRLLEKFSGHLLNSGSTFGMRHIWQANLVLWLGTHRGMGIVCPLVLF